MLALTTSKRTAFLLPAGNPFSACCLFFLVGILWSLPCFTQSLTDSLSSSVIGEWYLQSVKGGAALYNGPEYTGSYPGTKGSPFFMEDAYSKGMVAYDGTVYREVPLAYDLVSNELAIKGYQDLALTLNFSKIDSFQIGEHLFVHFIPDSTQHGAPPEDLYEIWYGGPVIVLVKRIKKVLHGTTAEEPLHFGSYNTYYLRGKNSWSRIENKQALLEAFPDRKAELTSFWKQRHLNLRKNTEETIIQTLQYINSRK
jgi:hypothetical protein